MRTPAVPTTGVRPCYQGRRRRGIGPNGWWIENLMRAVRRGAWRAWLGVLLHQGYSFPTDVGLRNHIDGHKSGPKGVVTHHESSASGRCGGESSRTSRQRGKRKPRGIGTGVERAAWNVWHPEEMHAAAC